VCGRIVCAVDTQNMHRRHRAEERVESTDFLLLSSGDRGQRDETGDVGTESSECLHWRGFVVLFSSGVNTPTRYRDGCFLGGDRAGGLPC
jgi:hypothetical protein